LAARAADLVGGGVEAFEAAGEEGDAGAGSAEGAGDGAADAGGGAGDGDDLEGEGSWHASKMQRERCCCSAGRLVQDQPAPMVRVAARPRSIPVPAPLAP